MGVGGVTSAGCFPGGIRQAARMAGVYAEATTVKVAVLAGEAAGADRPVDVYTLGGVKVKSGVKKGEALDGLRHGIYIVDGKKVVL